MRPALRYVPHLAFVLAASALAADSFTIRCDWLDRGNVDNAAVARGYSDRYPCIVNGGKFPNQAEYDLEFPVAADYTVSALYATAGARPVDILLDGKLVVQGFKGSTGSFNTSSAKWEVQCTAPIAQGKHTVRLLCHGPCIPHICGLRFESPVPFPKDWVLKRAVAKKATSPEPSREGFVGDYPLEPPTSYDYLQPYERIPLPNPRAHRILEYVLIGKGKHEVKAEVAKVGEGTASANAAASDNPARNEFLQIREEIPDEQADWVAHLSVRIDDKRTDQDTLPLAPAYLREMLKHTVALVDDFRTMKGVAPDYLAAERDEAAKLAAALDALVPEADAKAKWERFYQLYLGAYQLKGCVALRNPLLAFGRLVVAKRLTYNTSHIYTIYFDGSGRYKPGSGIFTLSPVRPDGTLTCLTAELKTDAIYRDPDVSWDARKVLFACKADGPTPTRVYEVGADGKGLRQLTDSPYDDVDPCYLPDGRIAFISTRCERVVLCHNAFTVSVLYTMDGEGSEVRCISTNTINDFTPSVLADGQIAVSQWRYVDMHVGNNQSLWRCNPDGTRSAHVAGGHFGPVTYWGARQVPGSQYIACILGPHMPYAVGPVALVHPMFTYSSPAVFTSLTPEIPPPSHATWQRREAGFYADVFPLSDKYFLVSYCYGPDPEDPTGYAIYLLDRWNNRDLVYRDPELSTFEVFPVKPRPRPVVIAPHTERASAAPNHADPAAAEHGTFFLLNVYDGLTGIKPGEVKRLRVLEEIPKPVSSRTAGYGLQNPVISYNGHFALKRIWGTVPVEADGSAYFKAPANRALYFSALDENHMEIQRMRSFTTVAPGEQFGCIGCHERKFTAPPNGQVLALRRPPSEIAPPLGGIHAPDFYHDAQPVLDRHCTKCHSGPQPKGGVDLSPDYTNIFNVAYETLCTKSLVNYANIYQICTLVTRPPKFYGSHASKLVEVIRTTHKDRVKMPLEDFERLVTWIDANCPYYGTYTYSRPNTTGGQELFARQKGALGDIFKRRCASCHGGAGEAQVLRVRLPEAEKTRSLLAPLAKTAGGDESCKKPVFADKNDPDYQKLAALLAEVKAECEKNPRADMLDRHPPMTDPNCRYVYRPGAVREGN